MFGNEITEIFHWIDNEYLSDDNILLYILYGCCYDQFN